MVRVIDDIVKEIENAREYLNYGISDLDDISEIYAIKFEGAFSHEDILRIIANLDNCIPSLIKKEVSLYDERLEGTHAYEIKFLDGSYINITIW